ncbi:hypothetical protein HD806DRAFT_531469 [Xylariaceae sp. AK1471]|nr:hypothetical protein HD806DRAFT_531469 [Xylariaceae sp. AK1471]
MFGGFAPPQLSAEEIRELEGEANWTVKQFLATAVVLYICTSKPHCPISQLTVQQDSLFVRRPTDEYFVLAPFVVEAVSGVF